MKKDFKKLCAYALMVSFISLNTAPAVFAQTAASDATAVQPAQTEPVQAAPAAQNAKFQIKVQSNVEHLPTYKKTVINTVNIKEDKVIISKGNVIKIAFADTFSTKTAKVGDKVTFVLQEDLKTVEGRVLLPAGTQFIAAVTELTPSKAWNRNAKVVLSINEIALMDGTTGTIEARVSDEAGILKRSGWAATGKAALWTVGLFGVGAGIGAAIGAAASAVGTGCLAIGMPVGGGLGLIIGSASKGLNYNAKPGKEIFVKLTQDLEICY